MYQRYNIINLNLIMKKYLDALLIILLIAFVYIFFEIYFTENKELFEN